MIVPEIPPPSALAPKRKSPEFVGPAYRSFWWSDQVDDPEAPDSEAEDGAPDETRRPVATEEEANLIGSWCAPPVNVAGPDGQPLVLGMQGDWHLPCIDIDHPLEVRESTTPGHFHLLIGKPMEWTRYVKLLDALADAGLVERGYVEASENRGQTFIRAHRSKPRKLHAGDRVTDDGDRIGTVIRVRNRKSPEGTPAVVVKWDGSPPGTAVPLDADQRDALELLPATQWPEVEGVPR